jgi:RNA polymerase-binding transcription factor DksA
MNQQNVVRALEAERDRLDRVRRIIEGEEGIQSQQEALNELSLSDQHPADLGSETFERTKDYGILESVRGELADVEHALRRLAAGTYGTCEACGRPIAPERLEVIPSARFCVEDQARAERDARAGNA